MIKTLFNGKKVPVIPQILVNNKLVTNFKDKVHIFNNFFIKQCQPNFVDPHYKTALFVI